MNIHVTQLHINLGYKGLSGHCPIALALGTIARTRAYSQVHANLTNLTFWSGDQIKLQIPTPKRVHQFISQFDTYGRSYVKPFTFHIPLSTTPFKQPTDD